MATVLDNEEVSKVTDSYDPSYRSLQSGMVRQKSGEMSSPTPSIDSLNGLALCENAESGLDAFPLTFSSSGVSSATSSASSLDRASTGSASSSSGLSTSPLGGSSFASSNSKCPVCSSTFISPKVLPCFHTFCQSCLERCQEHSDKITCPTCQTDCQLGPQGVAGLLADYGVSSSATDSALDLAGCTGCKSRESNAVARCFDCSNFLCANCVMAHQFMHCFEGHHVTTLGEISNSSGSHHVQELDSVNKLISEGKTKANEIRNNLKNLETTSTRLGNQYQKAVSEVNETYQFYVSMLEERRSEIVRELEQAYSNKQVALSVYSQKAQETVDKIFQVTDFVERLMKHATNGEVLLFKSPLETRLHHLLSYTPELNLASVTELEFISNFQAIQVGVKNQFGYVKSKPDSGAGGGVGPIGSNMRQTQSQPGSQQPPISRPIKSPTQQLQQLESAAAAAGANSGLGGGLGPISSMVLSGILDQQQNVQQHSRSMQQSQQHHQQHHQQLDNSSSSLLAKRFGGGGQQSGNSGSPSPFPSGNLSSLLSGCTSIADLTSGLGGHNSLSGHHHHHQQQQHMSAYEKWSNGSDSASLFGLSSQPVMGMLGGLQSSQQDSLGGSSILGSRLSGLATSMAGNGSSGGISQHSAQTDIMELRQKMLSAANVSVGCGSPSHPAGLSGQSLLGGGGGSTNGGQTPLYPPKSQIKRQKMIYHCKFGEFGILEGQFTEPSGVAVNAQNDIIVADTNNHRIQIFDKEGRFKFQFGEVGKRDGQLLYPNRVAVVKTSGDIIVTERSPTHQIQIYNQYGQFVRKFGANILQHPRGVCVDNKGRIIVVECKVMRVIIFDQHGNVLNKFGCSKHLEFPNGVVVNDRQEIFISDNRAHCVKVFDYDGNYLRQIGGEGITNYPIGVGINAAGEITIADNHNNFNLSVFSQEGQLISALESKVKHAQCFDVALMDDGSVVLASKDYRLYIYRYIQVPPIGM